MMSGAFFPPAAVEGASSLARSCNKEARWLNMTMSSWAIAVSSPAAWMANWPVTPHMLTKSSRQVLHLRWVSKQSQSFFVRHSTTSLLKKGSASQNLMKACTTLGTLAIAFQDPRPVSTAVDMMAQASLASTCAGWQERLTTCTVRVSGGYRP